MVQGTVLIRMERRGLNFLPGQYIHVAPRPGRERREYSIYSASSSDYLEILVREIPQGSVSPQLCRLKPGDEVEIEGPFGFFVIEEYIPESQSQPYLFIATGTGISPFHSLIHTYHNLNYRLVHGTRTLGECYHHSCYSSDRIVSCVTREEGPAYKGRVTEWLKANPPAEDSLAYLCGNCDMIYQVYDILGGYGITGDRIHSEVYF